MIKWHPDTATLAAYAAGTLSDGMTLLVSGHLTLCPHCRDRVSAMEAVGGSLIQETAPVAIGGGALAAVMDRIGAIEEEDEEEPVIARAFPRDTPLPRPIQHAVGSDLDTLNWQFRLPGLHEYTLPGFDGEDVSLIRARPGAQMLS
ncbi:MAG: transcriptional regulator, partial [Rubricella sp.]